MTLSFENVDVDGRKPEIEIQRKSQRERDRQRERERERERERGREGGSWCFTYTGNMYNCLLKAQ